MHKQLQQALSKRQNLRLAYISLLIISVGLVIYVIVDNWTTLQSQDLEVNFSLLGLAIVLYPIGMIPTATAWHLLLRSFDVHHPFKLDLRLYALANLPRRIPGLVWFYASRSMLYRAYKVPGGVSVTASIVETILLALMGLCTSALTLSLSTARIDQFQTLRVVSITATSLLALVAVFHSRFISLLIKNLNKWGIDTLPVVRPKVVFVSMMWMIVAWSGGGFLLFICSKAVAPLSWDQLPIMIGIWGGAGAISLTIGAAIQGIGIRELTMIALLSSLVSSIPAIIIAICFRLVLTVGELCWIGLIVLATRNLDR